MVDLRRQPLILGFKYLLIACQPLNLLAQSNDGQSLVITQTPLPIQQAFKLLQLSLKRLCVHGRNYPPFFQRSSVRINQPTSVLYIVYNASQQDNEICVKDSQPILRLSDPRAEAVASIVGMESQQSAVDLRHIAKVICYDCGNVIANSAKAPAPAVTCRIMTQYFLCLS